MKDLKIRSISGLLYVALITFAALYSDLSFISVIFLFTCLAVYEFQKLINYKSPVPLILFGLIIYQFYGQRLHPYIHLGLLALSIGVNFLLANFLFLHKKIVLKPMWKIYITLFYMVASGYFIIASSSLNSSIDNGISLSMYILVWINNSFAYLIGSKWGKRLLFKNISPKKTWEGFLGGASMCFFASFFLIAYHPTYPLWTFPLLALIIAMTASVGDLIQSKFKRQAKVKDSGSLIPGHGGFYDRMDSILFTAPFVYLFLMFTAYVS